MWHLPSVGCSAQWASIKSHSVRTLPTVWLLLFGLLLQSLAAYLPAQQVEQLQRLVHERTHAVDHGHHTHHLPDASGLNTGHDTEMALMWEAVPEHADHGPHHSHASDSAQVQALPMSAHLSVARLPTGVPPAGSRIQPDSAVPDGLLRPPQHLV